VGPTERIGVYSVGVNLFLVSLKLGLAALSGSLALAADAVHSLVDVVASLVVLGGLLIARRKSRSFPYGLYKVENLVSAVVALLIFLAGYELAREALFQPSGELANAPLALGGVALAMLTTYLFSRYERRLGEESGSPSLLADSSHFRVDVLSSAVVFVAILGDYLGLPLDRLGAGVVLIFVVWAGWELLVDGMRVLLDASLDPETLEQVRRIIGAERSVAEVRSLVGRNSGRYKFLEAEVALRTRDLEKAHQVSQRLEEAIRARVPHVDRVLIHYEPLRKDIWRWAVPIDSPEGIVSPHLGQAPYFALVDVRMATGEVVGSEVLVNPYLHAEKQKGIRVAEFLTGQGMDGLVVRESLEGKGPAYVLADAGVEVRLTQRTALGEVLEELRSRQTDRVGLPGEVGALVREE